MNADPQPKEPASWADAVDQPNDAASRAFVALLPGEAVACGAVVAVDVGEVELVVWRTAEGEAVVTDARCPHQWSHLEAEGVVDGDELVCTSHFWRFDTRGCGSKLTETGRRDPKADIDTYPSRERDGVIEAALELGPADGLDDGPDGGPDDGSDGGSGTHDDVGGSGGRIL